MTAEIASSPPLRIWLYGAVLAAGLIGLLFPLRLWVEREVGAVAVAHAQAYLSERPPQAQARVLGLGSSLLWAATPPTMYQPLQGVQWMRMTKGGGGLGYLRAVMDMFDDHPPDVLVIEANLLLPSTPQIIMDEMRFALTQTASDMGYRVLERVGISRPSTQRLLSDQYVPFACETMSADALQKQMPKLVDEQNATLASVTIEPDLLDHLLRLAQRGVHIVILDLRRSPPMEQAIGAAKQRWLQRWQSALPPGPHVSYISSPMLPEPDFCDGRHMNAAGARLFVAWWTEQLKQLQHMAQGR